MDALRRYQCANPPQRLWRVQHEGSKTRFHMHTGDLNATRRHPPRNAAELREYVKKHLRPGHGNTPTPLLSVFDDQEKAMQWAEARHDWHNRRLDGRALTILFEVDTFSLQETLIFKVYDLRSSLNLPIGRDTSNEYLILCNIPSQAIRVVARLGSPFHDDHAAANLRKWRQIRAGRQPRLNGLDLGTGHDQEAESSDEEDGAVRMLEI